MNIREVVPYVAEDAFVPIANYIVKSISVLHRILHRLLFANILPRGQKHLVILIQDFFIIYNLLLRKPINLARPIMLHMDQISSSSNNGMSYPGIVKRILTHCETYDSDDEVDCWESFRELNLERMSWLYSSTEGWTKKETK